MVGRLKLLVLCFFLVTQGFAQVIVTQSPLNPSVLSIEDFWNFSTVSTQEYKIKLEVVLSAQGRVLLKFMSSDVTIKSGYQDWNSKDVTYQEVFRNSSHPYANYIGASRTLPFGDYQICLNLLDVNSMEELGNSCTTHEFNPLTPVMLISPDYCSELLIKTPIFTWMPPTPHLTDYPLFYDLKICEVFEGQTHQDAIDHNIPWHTAAGLFSTTYPYPIGAAPFDTTKVYVWQVNARMERPVFGELVEPGQSWKGLGLSEVWCFHWKHEKEPDIVLQSYLYPQKNIETGFVNIENDFPLAFKHTRGKGGVLTIRYFDNQGNKIDYTNELNLVKGDNRFDIPLRSSGQFKHKEMYMAIITDPFGKEYKIRFKYWER